MAAPESQIEASFCGAINTAKEQKSVSLQKRAEATYAEYRHRKRVRHEDVNSDHLFANRLGRLPFVISHVSTSGPAEASGEGQHSYYQAGTMGLKSMRLLLQDSQL